MLGFHARIKDPDATPGDSSRAVPQKPAKKAHQGH